MAAPRFEKGVAHGGRPYKSLKALRSDELMSVSYKKIGELRMKKLTVCFAVLLLGCVSSLGSHFKAGESREAFWERFRTAVIKKDKAAVASLSQYPISMPYGYRTVRNKPQLNKRSREVFNHEGDAAVCFAAATPRTDSARPEEFTVGCKNPAGDEVVIYLFVLTKNGWRFNGLDNINE